MKFKRVRMKAPSYDSVQITVENMAEIVEHFGGKIVTDSNKIHIAIEKTKPSGLKNPSVGYVGDWVVRNRDTGDFTIFPQSVYENGFVDAVTVRCRFCMEDKEFSDIAKRSDGQFSTMCTACEIKQLAEIQGRRDLLMRRENEGSIRDGLKED